MKSYLVIIFFALASAGLTVKGDAAAENLDRFKTSQKRASGFLPTPRVTRARGWWSWADPPHTVYGARHECCDEFCYIEERREMKEEHGSRWVDQQLCHFSFNERRYCLCQGETGDYECRTRHCCSSSQFQCLKAHPKVKCVDKRKRCDSANDCGKWEDEDYCEFDSSLKTSLSEAKHFGNVLVGGRPVCDSGWNQNAAKVVCNELGFDKNTIAKHFTKSTYGSMKNSRLNYVKCKGNEKRLHDCRYKLRNDCSKNNVAGVVCIDPSQLNLKGGQDREGNVYIGDYPVCDHSWDTNDAQVVCNRLFGTDFPKRKNVPVFEVKKGSFFGSSKTKNFIVDNVRCHGSESEITDCPFVTHDKENCDIHEVAGVKCAKCTPEKLLKILNMVGFGDTSAEYRESIVRAFKELKSECHEWTDCTNILAKPIYPEYCEVKLFLEEAVAITSGSLAKRPRVSLRYKVGELIKHLQTKELLIRIDDLSDQVESFKSELGEYFKSLATFDKERAAIELKSLRAEWKSETSQIENKQIKLGNELDELFKLAFSAQGAEIAYAGVKFGLAVASIKPFSIEKAGEIYEKAATLADSAADMVELGFTFSDTLPKFRKLAQSMIQNFDKNAETLKKMKEVTKMDSLEKFSKSMAMEFLALYKDYNDNPPIKANEADLYGVLIEQMVENACEVLNSPGGVIKAAIRSVAVKVCPTIKQDVHVLQNLFARLVGIDDKTKEAFVFFARSKLSEVAASELITDNHMLSVVLRKKAKIVFQVHREQLINDACDTIKYIHFGIEQEYCKRLRRNTFGDTAGLVAFKYDDNKMCSDKYSRHGVFNIPAMVRSANYTIPDGTLDLTDLFGTFNRTSFTTFQIPNAQWLVDNKWIDKEQVDNGPFLLKQFQLYSLPIEDQSVPEISSGIFLIKNNFNGEVFSFDENVRSFFSYKENSLASCNGQYRMESPYNDDVCSPFGDVCMTSEGMFEGPIYPSLTAKWSLQLSLPRETRSYRPFPEGVFHLKVRATFCFRQHEGSRKGKKVADEKEAQTDCCTRLGKNKDEHGNCQFCDGTSTARANSYYCELCPPGFELSSGMYGCQSCPIDTFKDTAENSTCQPCEQSMSTWGTIGNLMCSEEPIGPSTTSEPP